jgi:signal transduction histidine kinase
VRRARGFRVRVVVALVATSAATLVAAILTLVPPLDHRLQQDRLSEMRNIARTARFGLVALPGHRLRQGSPSVRRLVVDLQRRMGGRVALYAADGESLADTDPDRRVPGTGRLDRQEDRRRLALRGDVREGIDNGEAVVVAGVRRASGEHLTLVLRKSLGDTRAAGNVVRAAVPTAAAVGAGVALLLALALSRGLLTRLRRLRDDARALGDEGLGHPVEVGPPDEFGEVAGALETMRARLVEEEAARQAFLATASHELRTPLATLQGTLELLQEGLDGGGPAEASAARARADAALHQTHRLVGLATDLLDLNRIDGEGPLSAEPVELVELAGVLRGDVADALAASGRALEIEGAGPVHALADPAAALRILSALLDNARAYGAGTVTVTIAHAADGAAVVGVGDEGPGLADEDRERLFRRFERGPAAGSHPGFGLGLPLARGLAERMGGSLAALPAERGASFELRLPGWSPAAEPGVAQPARSARTA